MLEAIGYSVLTLVIGAVFLLAVAALRLEIQMLLGNNPFQ